MSYTLVIQLGHVFCVDDFNAMDLLKDLQVVADSYIRYAIEVQYCCIPISQDHVTEVWGVVSHAHADHITSKAPLSTLDKDELGIILSLILYLQVRVDAIGDYALWVVAHAKFYNFHGQPGVPLEANLYIYSKDGNDNEPEENSSFLVPSDFLFFCAPSEHTRELESIWVDSVVNYA
ncbi:hypothetical protein BS17DRAFT_765469 [Gyrodon lividus]|nr:hypothetical protein BS17DRAFT_765469 [Gyrodon lividus]